MMKKLFGVAVLGAIGWGLRKLMNRSNPADVDLREPQKTVEKVEAAVGEPVRP
jgi:hypothetical protein